MGWRLISEKWRLINGSLLISTSIPYFPFRCTDCDRRPKRACRIVFTKGQNPLHKVHQTTAWPYKNVYARRHYAWTKTGCAILYVIIRLCTTICLVSVRLRVEPPQKSQRLLSWSLARLVFDAQFAPQIQVVAVVSKCDRLYDKLRRYSETLKN